MSARVERLDSKDFDVAVDLIHKFWTLNSEFEPMIELSEQVVEEIKRILKADLNDKEKIILVGKVDGKVVGLIRAEVKSNSFSGSRPMGNIVEFYVVPRYRRVGIGERLLNAVMEKLRERSVDLVTAEFPTQNVVAVGFYVKNLFSPFITVYARKLRT